MTKPPNLFAEYAPRAERVSSPPPGGLVVRAAGIDDADALANIAWERNGGHLADYTCRFTRDLSNHPMLPDNLWLTALVKDEIAGYGKAGLFTPAPDAPENTAPHGWYLFGVTVAPRFRRLGIARELTRERLDYIAQRANRAYYFASALNRASIDLHRVFGFVEVTRDFHFPNASFTGGVGILFSVGLDRSAP